MSTAFHCTNEFDLSHATTTAIASLDGPDNHGSMNSRLTRVETLAVDLQDSLGELRRDVHGIGERLDSNVSRIDARITGLDASVRGLEVTMHAELRAVKESVQIEVRGLRDYMDASLRGTRETMDASLQGMRETMDANLQGMRETMDTNQKGMRETMDASLKGMRETMEANTRGLSESMATAVQGLRDAVAASSQGLRETMDTRWESTNVKLAALQDAVGGCATKVQLWIWLTAIAATGLGATIAFVGYLLRIAGHTLAADAIDAVRGK